MMQIDKNTIVELLSKKSQDGLPMMTMFKGKSIVDMTNEELAALIYFVVEDHHRLSTLLGVLTKRII